MRSGISLVGVSIRVIGGFCSPRPVNLGVRGVPSTTAPPLLCALLTSPTYSILRGQLDPGGTMARRNFLKQLAALPFFTVAVADGQTVSRKSLRIMMKSAWGSDDPTKAAFPFLHGLALSEAGHEVQIFLLGEAVSLMRASVAEAVVPVGWPPLAETLSKIATKKIPVYAFGACSRARGVTEADLTEYGAKFGNPKIFVSLVEWADRIITE